MSTFEQTLVAELRAEADAASAATDTAAMRAELRRRLDAQRGQQVRRRWTSAVAAVAAAAVVVGLAVVVSGREQADVPPATDISTTPWTGGGEILSRPQLNLPAWAADVDPVVTPRRLVRWQNGDRSLTLFQPLVQWLAITEEADRVITWDATPMYLDLLDARDGVSMSTFVEERTVNAGVANVAVVTTTQDVPGGLGCSVLMSPVTDCEGLPGGTRSVLAVMNVGDAPLLLVSTAPASTDPAAQDEEMRQVLGTLRITGAPVACTADLAPLLESKSCLPELWTRIQRDAIALADGGDVTRDDYDAAYRPLGEALSAPGTGVAGAWSYQVERQEGDAPTSPLVVSWTINAKKTTAYVCFSGPSMRIGTSPCP